MFPLLQAAQAVAVAPPDSQFSLGAWISVVGCAISVGALLVTFGRVLERQKNLEVNTAAALQAIRENVQEALARVERALKEIQDAMAEQTTRQIEDAGWAATIEGEVRAAVRTSEEAKGIAHKARTTAQELISRVEGFERRSGTERREG